MKKALITLILFSSILLISCSKKVQEKRVLLNAIDNQTEIKYRIDSIDHKTIDNYVVNSETTEGITKEIYKDPGVIPNHDIAIKIAFIYLSQLYGKDTIIEEFPLNIDSIGQYWIISGTLHTQLGGVAHITLRKDNGMVISMYHEK
jgi:tetrahydromethanopterin S-methyltransferase subunit G